MSPARPSSSKPSARRFPPVRFVTGGAFELVAELSAFTSGTARGSLDSGKSWIREVRALAGPELVTRVERYGINIYAELATIALDAAEPRGTVELLATMRGMGADAFRRRMFGADSAMTRSMVSDGAIDRALAGDVAAVAEFRSKLGFDRATRVAIDRLVATPADALLDDFTGIVAEWAEQVFIRFAPDALAAVEREVAFRADLLDGPGHALVRAVTRGVAFEPPAWIHSIVLAPSVALRPFMIPIEIRDTTLFLYSVADEAFEADPAAPPRQLVKVAAALGDERRLRVLYVLRGGELTASEIAERLGVDRTSIHHHLGILRSAGLLAIRDDGVAGWRYGLEAGGWSKISAALDGYLRAPDD